MQVKARPLHQPVTDQLRLVGAVIVQDQVDVQFRWQVLLNRIEESAKFHRAMATLSLANHRAGLGVQGGRYFGSANDYRIVSATT